MQRMIDPTTPLAAMIRAQFRAHDQLRATEASGAEGVPPRPEASAQEETQELAPQLQQLVALRIRGLDADDPYRRRKAFRVFLEAVLVQTFGRDRIDGPAFDQMVDKVMHRMESDAALSTSMSQAGELLLARAAQPSGASE